MNVLKALLLSLLAVASWGTAIGTPAPIPVRAAFKFPHSYGCDNTNEQPLYRLFNNREDVNHRYTISVPVRDAMVAAGWVLESRYDGIWSCTLK